MPKYKKKKTVNYDIKDLETAIHKVKSGELSVRKASETYNIPKSTIGDRVSGKRETSVVGRGRKPALPPDMETNIVSTIKRASQIGVGVTRKQLLDRTGALVKKMKMKTPFKNSVPGKDWWKGLKHRHADLSIRKPEKTGDVRCRMMNRTKVEEYFRDLGSQLIENNLLVQPKKIWNMDETGKSFEHEPVKVIAIKGTKNVTGRTCSPETHVTIVACANADGIKMSPLIIVTGKTERSLYGFNTTEAPRGTLWDYQENGWINDRIGERWFKELFLQQCGPERPQLLLLDGHSSHESLALIEEGIRENIIILSLPPHTTHWLQPLDRSVFGPFTKHYNLACAEFLQQNTLHKVDKWTFPALMCSAWKAGVTKENIVSGFRACGIHPFNPAAIPDSAYLPSEPSEYLPSTLAVDTTNTLMSAERSFDNVNPSTSGHVQSDNVIKPSSSGIVAIPSTSRSSVDVVKPSSSGSSVGHMPSASVGHMPSASGDACFSNDLSQVEVATIDDSEQLLQLIIDDKIDVVGMADENGVVSLSTDWNSEITSLFLPSSLPKHSISNTNKPSAPKRKKSNQSHRLLTSEDVLREKRLIVQKREEKEQKKTERQLKKLEEKPSKCGKKKQAVTKAMK